MLPTYKLMIPGPVEVSPEVLKAMGEPIFPHYGPEWTRFYNETLTILRTVFNTSGSVFLMVGSGTVAIDACIGSAFQTGEKILVGLNGFFGERLKAIAESYGLQVIPVTADWGKPLQPEQFEQAYKDHPDARGAAVVHLETSTTIINPIESIGPIIRKHDGIFMVDGVSSLGGVPFHMEDWCIDLCAAATQKCLGAPPGLAPVAVGPRGWQSIDRQPMKAHGWYGDLRVWRWYATEWGDWHPSPITMATNNIRALSVALSQLMDEGIEARLARYRKMAIRLRAGLERLGLSPFTPLELMNPVLTAAWVPEGTPSSKLVNFLADKHKLKISTGLGQLKERLIRVGHMSPVVGEKDIDNVLFAIQDYLSS